MKDTAIVLFGISNTCNRFKDLGSLDHQSAKGPLTLNSHKQIPCKILANNS